MSLANDNKQRRCLGGNPGGVHFFFFPLIFAIISWLFLPFLCVSPYIGDNVSFKCGGGDLGFVCNLFSKTKKEAWFFKNNFLKKRRVLLFFFLWFLAKFGCVCHEQIQLSLKNS